MITYCIFRHFEIDEQTIQIELLQPTQLDRDLKKSESSSSSSSSSSKSSADFLPGNNNLSSDEMIKVIS